MSEGVTGSDGGGGRLMKVCALDIATMLQSVEGAGNILWRSCELLSAGMLWRELLAKSMRVGSRQLIWCVVGRICAIGTGGLMGARKGN